jgi:hypothetical protein
MKWITREHAKVDRIACPWLIKNFVDGDARFLFAPSHKVIQIAKEEEAIPFDIPNVELGHHGEECSFDAIIKKYELDKEEPALLELAKIVRGADTPNRRVTTLVSFQVCTGTDVYWQYQLYPIHRWRTGVF